MVYLDYAAATPVDPEVFQAMKPWFSERYGNPSSLHRLGQEARAAVDNARMSVAQFLSCQPTEILFTSSGTERCNWALLGVVEQRLLQGGQAHIVLSEVEHSAVLNTARFLEKTYGARLSFVPVGEDGVVKPSHVEAALNDDTVLVSIMMVNNEIGTVQPTAEIGAICKERGIYFHTDACQAAGFYDLDVDALNVDLLSINAAKIYGPKGIGILYIREKVIISEWSFGGGQEFNMHAGTENVPAIVGMGKAVEILKPDIERISSLRDQLWQLLQEKISGVQLNGSMKHRSPNNLNIHIPGRDGETLMKKLDLAGFAISTGSACASGTVEPSHVLLALGLEEAAARSSIRISLGKNTQEKDIPAFADALVEALQSLSP